MKNPRIFPHVSLHPIANELAQSIMASMGQLGVWKSKRVYLLALATFVSGCDRQASPPDDHQSGGSAIVRPSEDHGVVDGKDRHGTATTPIAPDPPTDDTSVTAAANVALLQAERQRLDQQIWAAEVAAQRHEQFFVALWDRLRSAEVPLNVLMEASFAELVFPTPLGSETLELGIRSFLMGDATRTLAPNDWRQLGTQLQRQGFQLLESEWHHSTFEQSGERRQSQVSFVLHLSRPLADSLNDEAPQQRILVRGELEVTWQPERATPTPGRVVVKNLEILTRTGLPLFRRVLTYRRRQDQFASAHPIIVYDLDANGYPEILISRWNRVYWNQGGGRFQEATLFDHFLPLAESGVVADVTTDGHPDFVAIDKRGRLVTYVGDARGRFVEPPLVESVIEAADALAMTAGDVDGDHDLDLWVTQYKPSYLKGQMPTPYYDANDGEPSYLLLNDGQAGFRDATQAAGLDAKRRRRTYSTSFFDWDDDGDQDLLVVSDYAGIDLHENQGEGRFVDVTEQQLPERHLFGMAHTLADFDRDGHTDIYAIGMSSTTARRLDRLGLGRDDRPDIHQMRSVMGYGNRMYLRRAGGFESPSYALRVARTGWSWGTTSFDFDRDGDRDIYVANGFRSGRSCQDYCTTFWRHDIYTGSSDENRDLQDFFQNSMRDLDRGQISWNGFEHNRLLVNFHAQDYADIAFLLGVGFEYDARAVVGADLDSDGLPDLIVAEYEFVGQGFELTLHVYQNTLQTDHHWLGVDLHRHRAGRQPIGAKVIVSTADGPQVGRIVTGDSFLSQHPARLHFGLGNTAEVERVEIHWQDGSVELHTDWEPDQYHVADP